MWELKDDMFNMWAECCNKRSQNMCVVARNWCTYVLYSVVYKTTPLRLKKIVNRRISIHSISKYYIYREFILCNIFRNERGMKINEMTGERVKKNSNRVVFLILFFYFYLCGVWCKVKKWVVLKNKMGWRAKRNRTTESIREVICMVNKCIS